MSNTIYWGISPDLQADIRYEPNACKGYVMDISLGCPNHCLYCLFSPLELKIYKLKNPGYKGDVLPLKLDKFLARNEFPPAVYLCYSSDPLGNEELVSSTKTILRRLLSENVAVFFISKSVFGDEIIEIISENPGLMHIQVGLTSTDCDRNKIIEPGAPSCDQRIENLKKLQKISGLGSLTVRIDPILPGIDDSIENITSVIDEISSLGISEAVFGYLIVTGKMKETWKQNQYLKVCAKMLTEKTPTISEQELFSVPFDYKLVKFSEFERICRNRGVKMSCCGCKDERLKTTGFEWICHPFNRKRREELAHASKSTDFRIEVAHLDQNK